MKREELAKAGIITSYIDVWGEEQTAGEEAAKLVLDAMGVSFPQADDPWPLEPVFFAKEGERALVPLKGWSQGRKLTLEGQSGGFEAEIVAKGGDFAALLPLFPVGRHVFDVFLDSATQKSFTLIVAPQKGFRPTRLSQGAKLRGVCLPLYSVKSGDNWGVGDFGDLGGIVAWAGLNGADVVGLLPLHALFNSPPLGISPYFPVSRIFLNPLYISVPQVYEWRLASQSGEFAASGFGEALQFLRDEPLVDYEGAWNLKRRALWACFEVFDRKGQRGADFDRWKLQQGEKLKNFATFCAIWEDRKSHWREWPPELSSPSAPGVARFVADHSREVDFHCWLQWLADGQLRHAKELAMRTGMAVGLYLDMALGVDPGGADAWAYQDVLAQGVSIGCPPDPFALLGQKWGLPPLIPTAHRGRGYNLAWETLTSNAAYAGALRIDHAAGLARLFWIPDGLGAKDGVYVANRLEEELALLRAVSALNSCVIVGEDLGTVPEEVRRGLMDSGFFSYRLMVFERDCEGECLAPHDFPSDSLVQFATHDLPTLKGWWLGTDLELKARLGLYPDEKAQALDRENRVKDKEKLVAALTGEGYLAKPADGEEPDYFSLSLAVHKRLGASKSLLALVNVDDVFGQEEMQNMPGTLDEHPNWRRKCLVPLEDWWESNEAIAILRALTLGENR